jgi:hypothetical protein
MCNYAYSDSLDELTKFMNEKQIQEESRFADLMHRIEETKQQNTQLHASIEQKLSELNSLRAQYEFPPLNMDTIINAVAKHPRNENGKLESQLTDEEIHQFCSLHPLQLVKWCHAINDFLSPHQLNASRQSIDGKQISPLLTEKYVLDPLNFILHQNTIFYSYYE